MKEQPNTSRATAKGQSKADSTGCSVGSHEALSCLEVASQLNNQSFMTAQIGQIKAEVFGSSGKPDATDSIWICPEIPWQSEPETRSRVAELVRRLINIPHVATIRGTMAGSKWASKVTEFVGPQLQPLIREALDNWLVDEKNIAFLSAIHACCFGGEMIAAPEEKHRAAYIRGFVIGVQDTWNSKEAAVQS